MSEIGEQPTPQEAQRVQQRLEDMEEFKRLSPEQQERLLALRERLMEAAANPQEVVTRNVEDMGFWEGMYHTAKPHLQEKKKLIVKDIKAKASLTLSLIPVLGQGMGVGKGLFGVYKAEKVFEPARRLKAAKDAIKPAVAGVREMGKVVQAAKVAEDATRMAKFADWTGKAAEWTTRPFRMLWAGGTAPLVTLNAEYAKHATSVAAKMLEGNTVHEMRQGAAKAAEAARATKVMEEMDKAAKAGNDLSKARWFELKKQWQKGAIARKGRAEAAREFRQWNKTIDMNLEAKLKGSGAGWLASKATIEAQKVKPTVVEGLGIKKYLAIFDQWFNLTPDVPAWLSTSTAIAEFLGMHGIDAIPAVIQMGVNKYKDVKLNINMAKDVYAYTKKRLLDKQQATKEATKAFTPAPAMAAA